jgi:hypothetical protein
MRQGGTAKYRPGVDAMQLNAYPEQKWWYEVEKT